MIYLTYNDPPSGIYFSQVIDVCNFLNEKLHAHVRLVSLISIRSFSQNKKSIKSHCPDAIVIPMFPGVKNWSCNFLTLLFFFFFLDSKKVIARGPFAASLALRLKKIGIVKWVCFDARGAYDAELNEYDVVVSKKINKDIFEIEKNVVLNSDFRIAVSNKLVSYWKEKYSYGQIQHVVIPCLLNSKYFTHFPDEQTIRENRKSLGFSDDDIVLVYSGSTAGWQSLELVDEFLYDLLKKNKYIKVLFLAKILPDKMKINSEFKNKIVCKWLREAEVPDILSCCDYGILIREKSMTNKVASPVKFAEYLACGLKVLVSEDLGDYTKFVIDTNCGYVVSGKIEPSRIVKLTIDEKVYLHNFSSNYFSKDSFIESYKLLISK